MTFEEAIVTELLLVSGLPTGKILWAQQTVERPALPYICLTPISATDRTWHPEFRYEDNPTGVHGNPSAIPPTIGTELYAVLELEHLPVVRIEYFCAPVTGTLAAREALHGVLHALLFPSSRARLRASDVVFVDHSPLLTLPALVGVKFEGRAVSDLTWRYMEVIKEVETYIGSVTMTGQLPDAGHSLVTTVSTEPPD